MAHLGMEFLGQCRFKLDSTPLTAFESNKVRGLLAYLAVEANRPHSREVLAGLLWPDWPDSAALSNLRYALSDLRKVIGDRTADPPFLLITRDVIQFNIASDHTLDVAEFTSLAAVKDVGQLELALQRYRGDFLAGFSVSEAAPFEDWARLKREQLRRAYLEALHNLTALLQGSGELERALVYARQLVDTEPLDESAQRQLMRLLALSGRRSEALAQFEACRRVLKEELKTEPSQETQQLYELLLKGELTSEAAAPEEFHTRRVSRPVGPCPYRGLAAFREQDAPFFFGREEFTRQLKEAIQQSSMIAVIVGSSGSGKSSVVYAGLLPRIREQGNWQIASFRPGEHPFRSLAGALLPLLEPDLSETELLIQTRRLEEALLCGELPLADIARRISEKHQETSQVLLVVDQFEELFTLCPDPDVRRDFLGQLLSAGKTQETRRDKRLILLLTMRADFMGQALAYRDFADALQQAAMLLGPMNREELRSAVEKPAELQGAAFEAGLVDRILDDVGSEPGSLPLLEFALTLLWEHQENGWLTHAVYDAIGLVAGSLATYADQVYDSLSPDEQERARSALLQLVQPGEGTEDTRRVALKAELGEENWQLIQHLADRRLVVTGRDAAGNETAEVVHEALIQKWGRYREWMEASRAFRSWQERLRENLRQWQESGREAGALLNGARLSMAQEWLVERSPQLGQMEIDYIQASLAEQQAQLEAQTARQRREAALERRARSFLSALVVILVLAVIGSSSLAYIARQAQGEAERQSLGRATQQAIAEQERLKAELRATEAYARELSQAAESNLERDPELSMLLALEAISVSQAVDLPVSLQMQDVLHRAMQAARDRLMIQVEGGAWGIDVSPDGSRLATAGGDGTIRLWDAQTGEVVQTLTGHSAAVEDVAFSPDGLHLASVSDDNTSRIWNLASGESTLTLSGHTAWFIAFSPDGSRLATADDDTVRIWNTTGQLLLELPGQTGNIAFSPDGSRLLTTSTIDWKSRVWNVVTGQEMLTLASEYGATGLAFSPDGKLLAAEGPEIGMITLYDAASSEPGITLCCHTAMVRSIDFNADGSLVATAGQEGVVKIWDANSGRDLFTLSGRMGPVDDLAFSPECAEPREAPFAGCGRYVYTASRNGVINKWDVSPAGSRDLLTVQGMDALFTPDSKMFEAVDLTRPQQLALHTWQLPPAGEALQVDAVTNPLLPARIINGNSAFFPDKTVALVASADGSVQTWVVGKPQEMISYNVPISTSESVDSVFVLQDGLRMATRNEQGGTQIWDIAAGKVLHSIPAQGALDLSTDGRRLAVGGGDGSLSLWDLTSGKKLREIPAHSQPVTGVAFNPEGTRLASGSLDTLAKVWDLASGQELYALPHASTATSPTFSPDGKHLAVNQNDGTLYLWDIDADSPASGQLLFKFTGLGEIANFNGFSPDGKIVYVGSYWSQRLRLYILPVEYLVALARSRLTRGFTQEECRQYLYLEQCP